MKNFEMHTLRAADIKIAQETIEKNESHDEKALEDFVINILAEYPALQGVERRRFTPRDAFDAGGYYEFEELKNGKVVPVIYISEGSAEALRPLLDIRKRSIEIMANLLGIEANKVTPQLLQLFIVAHELGHISDFTTNYQPDPNLPGWEAVEEMAYHRNAVLTMLPIPNMSPTHLARRLDGAKDINEVPDLIPALRQHPKFKEGMTVADLLRLQEDEYRSSDPERYADEFAAKAIQKYLVSLEEDLTDAQAA